MQLDFKLKGHEEAIVSLSVSRDGSSLASGAENGHMNLHDIEQQSISHSIHLPSLLAAPSDPSSEDEKDLAVASIAWASPHLVWASCSHTAMLVDLRTPPSTAAQSISVSDDIGSIALHEKGSHLALGDDSGTISLVDLTMSRPIKTMRPNHSSLVSCVLFRKFKPWDLVSSSLDHSVVRWDFSKGKSSAEWKLGAPHDEEGASRMFNPPMVHGVSLADQVTDVRPYASLAAAAVGDGSIAIFDLDAGDKASSSSQKMKAKAKLESELELPKLASGLRVDLDVIVGGHTAPASCVAFLPSQSLSVNPADAAAQGSSDLPLIVSGGEDRRILVWSLSRSLLCSWRKAQTVQGEELDGLHYHPLMDFKHKRKINGLAHARNNILLVADTAKFVSGFKF